MPNGMIDNKEGLDGVERGDELDHYTSGKQPRKNTMAKLMRNIRKTKGAEHKSKVHPSQSSLPRSDSPAFESLLDTK